MVAEPKIVDPRPEQLLQERLGKNDQLGIADLGIRINHGVAYIEGFVPSLRQKRLVSKLANRVEGLLDVVNMLRIVSLPVIDDDSLRKHITRALVVNPRIDQSRIFVEVVNGVMHLGGLAVTAAEKRLAEDEAWAAPGVRDVKNDIVVLSAAPKSETEIKNEILQCFSQCLGLDMSKVSVELRNGVAYLRGVVDSEYLKSAAEELVRWTPQIVDVANELRVIY